jgi:hypothetical protein
MVELKSDPPIKKIKMQHQLGFSKSKSLVNVIAAALFILFLASCEKSNSQAPMEEEEPIILNPPTPTISMDTSLLRTWIWDTITIPPYTYPDGTAFGDGLYTNSTYDPNGVSITDDKMRFFLDPINPTPPAGAQSPYNYRSEIHTDPWQINHPLGTEQWIGWRYCFPNNYVIDTTSPITIFQNHPGIGGLSPILELEIAAFDDPSPAIGGEIQVVDVAGRTVYPVRPEAGDSLDVVIQVVWGFAGTGLVRVWLNHELYHERKDITVLQDYPWGGNNKWGIYHHTFKNSQSDVQASINAGAEFVELYMGPLRLMTRTPSHPEYKLDAYHLVDPRQ